MATIVFYFSLDPNNTTLYLLTGTTRQMMNLCQFFKTQKEQQHYVK